MSALDYILFTHYNSPFTVTAIVKCIFDFVCLVHVRSGSSTRISPLLTAKLKYLHDFLTFTDEKYICDMSVMH